MSLGSFFKSFMTFLLPVAKAAIPVVGGVATASNPIVGAVIEGVPALMDAVEAISPKSNGAAKANAVQAAAKVMFDGLSATLTGGAKESFTTYQPLIQAVIDSGIAAVNAQPSSAPAASTDPAK